MTFAPGGAKVLVGAAATGEPTCFALYLPV